jgi:hypothetical protein
MSVLYNTNVIANPATAEAGKFIDLSGNTRFPSISVTRFTYPDHTSAYPGNSSQPIPTIDV